MRLLLNGNSMNGIGIRELDKSPSSEGDKSEGTCMFFLGKPGISCPLPFIFFCTSLATIRPYI